jgi:hypothetical protein
LKPPGPQLAAHTIADRFETTRYVLVYPLSPLVYSVVFWAIDAKNKYYSIRKIFEGQRSWSSTEMVRKIVKLTGTAFFKKYSINIDTYICINTYLYEYIHI